MPSIASLALSSVATIASSMPTPTCWPTPVVARWSSAARMAIVVCNAVIWSASDIAMSAIGRPSMAA